MDVYWNIFESISILIGIGIIGFIIIARKIVPIKILEVVSPLILEIALPCLIFTNIINRFSPESMELWWTLPLWSFAFAGITLLFTFITMRIIKTQNKPEFTISLLYPNFIFIPLLVIQNLFGENSNMLVELFLFTLIFPAFLFNTYYLFFKNKQKETKKFDWSKIFNPILIATALAVIIKLTGANDYIPNAFLKITKIIGNTALPLILIVIGGNVYVDFKRKGEIHTKQILLFVALKNFILPFLVLAVILIIRPRVSVAFLFVLISAVPPITAIPILTEKVGGNSSISNQLLIASYITSIISIPLIILLFTHFYEIM
ncbi:MAG: AEC family transporter [Bacteroidales bacterium]|nr:AEC family transporter [Bacteroidales bacterium]